MHPQHERQHDYEQACRDNETTTQSDEANGHDLHTKDDTEFQAARVVLHHERQAAQRHTLHHCLFWFVLGRDRLAFLLSTPLSLLFFFLNTDDR